MHIHSKYFDIEYLYVLWLFMCGNPDFGDEARFEVFVKN